MTHVLMVCSGNTCRSPMAAALLRQLAEAEGPSGLTVSSAGTAAMTGAPASEGAFLVALEAGLDLSAHQARPLTAAMVRDADLILAMSRSHLRRVEELGGSGKAMLLGRYATAGMEDEEIADPFGGGVGTYRETFRQLSSLMAGVRRRLEREPGDDQR